MKARVIVSALIVSQLFSLPAISADLPGSVVPEQKRSKARAHAEYYYVPALPYSECGAERSFDTVATNDNDFDPALGCSLRADVRAMVSRKSDLRRGRGSFFSDGERAANIVSAYRNWKAAPPHQPETPKTISQP